MNKTVRMVATITCGTASLGSRFVVAHFEATTEHTEITEPIQVFSR